MDYWLNENIIISIGKVRSAIFNLTEEYTKIIWNSESETKDIMNYIKHKEESEFIRILIDYKLLSPGYLKPLKINKSNINYELLNFAWIEITNKCNYKCIHCYGSFSPDNFEEMSLDDIKLTTRELKKLNINNIQVIGGEPFSLQKDKFKDILSYLAKHFKVIEIYTNGSFLDADWLQFIKKYNFKLSVSLYHHTEDIHNKITQNHSSYFVLKNTIKLIEDSGVDYRIGYTRTKLNKNTSSELLKNNLKIQNDNIKIDNIRVSGRGNFNLIDKEVLAHKSITYNTFQTLKLKSKNFIKNLSHHNCFSGKFYISSDLTVYPCVMERRINYGNLKYDNLDTLLSRNGKVINLTKEDIEYCRDCEFKYSCFDCRPDSISKNIKEKPYYCKYEPHKGIWND